MNTTKAMFGVSWADLLRSVEVLRAEMEAFSCHIHGKKRVGVCQAHWEAICRICGRCDGCLVADLGDEA